MVVVCYYAILPLNPYENGKETLSFSDNYISLCLFSLRGVWILSEVKQGMGSRRKDGVTSLCQSQLKKWLSHLIISSKISASEILKPDFMVA